MPDSQRYDIAVIGAGSWGTALAAHLARGKAKTILWGRDPEKVRVMASEGINEKYFPDIKLPESLHFTADIQQAISMSANILMVVPSSAFANTLSVMAGSFTPGHRLAWATKGFEPHTGRFLHEVVKEKLGEEATTAVVTGPTFAREVIEGKPTAITVASASDDFADELVSFLHHDAFRAYTGTDLIGAQLGGAVKNVLAIATGLADGMQLGLNARAALITRGLAEIMRLGQAMGAHPETLMGLAGLGDLVLTSTGDLSRNRRMGLALGAGKTVAQAQKEIGQVVEGVENAAEVMQLAEKYQVEMPISEQVDAVVSGRKSAAEALKDLLAREPKAEV